MPPNKFALTRTKLFDWIDSISLRQPPEAIALMVVATAVGVGSGYGAVLFTWLIQVIHELAFVKILHVFGFMGPYYVIIVPAIGGILVGPMVYFFAREAKGHGVPEVMAAIALRGGRIRPIVGVVKVLASAITIGTGGSVGREGPMVQIGAALGSTVGQALRLSEGQVSILVACGAAGGIAAAFNAPIAGAIFALEVIVADFSVNNFASVVVSSVVAAAIGRGWLGSTPAFSVPTYTMVSAWELLFYVGLGLVTAAAGSAFVWVLYRIEDLFDAWKFPEYAKTVPGGFMVGVLGFFLPQVFGVGYEAIGNALLGRLGAGLLVLLLVAKALATSITIGSGGSGGIFAPSLFLGAMLGGFWGTGVHQFFPDITAPSGAYAVVGMAAFFSAAARAPLTSIVIVFEMTNDYRLILPLMFATVISTVLAELLAKESIYTMKLVRRGVHLERYRDIDVMQGVLVGEVMSKDISPVPASVSLSELAAEFNRSHHHGLPVVDEQGNLYGIVTLKDLESATLRPDADQLTVKDIATTNPIVAYPDEPMWMAIRRLAAHRLGRLPVVERDAPQRLLGMIRRNDVIRAYEAAIVRRIEGQHRSERLRLGRLLRSRYIDMKVEPGSPADGRAVKDLALPETSLITAIQRGRQIIVPHGDSVLQAGDRVTIIATEECEPDLKACLGQAD
jgi:CIC family chloride channel protein